MHVAGSFFLLLEPPWVDSLRGGAAAPSSAPPSAVHRPLRRLADSDERLCGGGTAADSASADDGAGGECGRRGRGARLQAASAAPAGGGCGGAIGGACGGAAIVPSAAAADAADAHAHGEDSTPRVDTLELLDSRARLRLMLSLWPYVVPLVLVYWAESAAAACNPATPRAAACDPACCSLQPHVLGAATPCLQPACNPAYGAEPASLSLSLPRYAIQAGAWTAFALPPSELRDAAARQRAYELLNLCYQVG